MTQPVYVATVPCWLTALVNDGRVPLRFVTQLNLLMSILSEEDVSKYVLYASKLNVQTNGVFAEYTNVLDHPHNVAWRAQHAEAIAEAQATEKVMGCSDVQYDMEQCPYRPVGVDGDMLVLLESANAVARPRVTVLDEIVRTLSLLVGYPQAIQSRAFEAYLHARKATLA